MQANGLVVDALSKNHWDLGSIPRSTQIFDISFLNIITCSVPGGVYHMPPNISMPCVFKQQSNGQKMKTMVFPVKVGVDNFQSQQRLVSLMGQKF